MFNVGKRKERLTKGVFKLIISVMLLNIILIVPREAQGAMTALSDTGGFSIHGTSFGNKYFSSNRTVYCYLKSGQEKGDYYIAGYPGGYSHAALHKQNKSFRLQIENGHKYEVRYSSPGDKTQTKLGTIYVDSSSPSLIVDGPSSVQNKGKHCSYFDIEATDDGVSGIAKVVIKKNGAIVETKTSFNKGCTSYVCPRDSKNATLTFQAYDNCGNSSKVVTKTVPAYQENNGTLPVKPTTPDPTPVTPDPTPVTPAPEPDPKDTTAPVIDDIELVTKDKTNGKVELKVHFKDNESGLQGYKWTTNGNLTAWANDWTKYSEEKKEDTVSFFAEKNDTYYFYAANGEGLVAKKSIKVENIDTTKPTIKFNPTVDSAPYATSKTVKATLTDDSGIAKYWFGKQDEINKMTEDQLPASTGWTVLENQNQSETVDLTFHENGIYFVYAEDSVGNVNKEKYEIKYIDNEDPELYISVPSQKIARPNTVDIIVSGIDNQGVDLIAIDQTENPTKDVAGTATAFVGGAVNNPTRLSGTAIHSSNTFSIKENSVYYVHVYDKVGNVTTKPVIINNLVDDLGDYTGKKIDISSIGDGIYVNYNFVLTTTQTNIKRVVLKNKTAKIDRGYWLGYFDDAGFIDNYDPDPAKDPEPYLKSDFFTAATARTVLRVANGLDIDNRNYQDTINKLIGKENVSADERVKYQNQNMQIFAYDLNGDGQVSSMSGETPSMEDVPNSQMINSDEARYMLRLSVHLYDDANKVMVNGTVDGDASSRKDFLTYTKNNSTLFPEVDDEGEYEFYTVGYDGLTRQAANKYKIVLDKTSPAVKMGIDERESTEDKAVYKGVAIDDTTDIVAYQFRTDTVVPDAGTGWINLVPSEQQIAIEKWSDPIDYGKQVYFYVKDRAGNIGYTDINNTQMVDNSDIKSPTIEYFKVSGSSDKGEEVAGSVEVNGQQVEYNKNSTVRHVMASVKDETGLGWYKISNNGSLPANSENWIEIKDGAAGIRFLVKNGNIITQATIDTHYPIEIGSNGKEVTKEQYLYVKDLNGNISVKSLYGLQVKEYPEMMGGLGIESRVDFNRDTQKPKITNIEQYYDDGCGNFTSLYVTADDFGGSGIAAYRISKSLAEEETNNNWIPITHYKKGTGTEIEFKIDVKDNHAYWIQVKDNASGYDYYENFYVPNVSRREGRIAGDINVQDIVAKVNGVRPIVPEKIRINEEVQAKAEITTDNSTWTEVTPESGIDAVEYDYANNQSKQYITLDKFGKITGKKVGIARIKITITNYDGEKVTVEKDIQVLDEEINIAEQPHSVVVVGEGNAELNVQLDKGTGVDFEWYELDKNATLSENQDPESIAGAHKMQGTDNRDVDSNEKNGSTLTFNYEDVSQPVAQFVVKTTNNSNIGTITGAVLNPLRIVAELGQVASIDDTIIPVMQLAETGATGSTEQIVNSEVVTVAFIQEPTLTNIDARYDNGTVVQSGEWATEKVTIKPESTFVGGTGGTIKYDYAEIAQNSDGTYPTLGESDWKAYTNPLVYDNTKQTVGKKIFFRVYTEYEGERYAVSAPMEFELKLDTVAPTLSNLQLTPINDIEGEEGREYQDGSGRKWAKNYKVEVQLTDNFRNTEILYFLEGADDNALSTSLDDWEKAELTYADDTTTNGTGTINFLVPPTSGNYHLYLVAIDEALNTSERIKSPQLNLDIDIDQAGKATIKDYDDHEINQASEYVLKTLAAMPEDLEITYIYKILELDKKYHLYNNRKGETKVELKELTGNDYFSGLKSIQYSISTYSASDYQKMINILKNRDAGLTTLKNELQSLKNDYQRETNFVRKMQKLALITQKNLEIVAYINANIDEVEPNKVIALDKEDQVVELGGDGCYVVCVTTTDNVGNEAHEFYLMGIDNNDDVDTQSTINCTQLPNNGGIKVVASDISGIRQIHYKWIISEEDKTKIEEKDYSSITGLQGPVANEGAIPIKNLGVEGKYSLLIKVTDNLGNVQYFVREYTIDGKVTNPSTLKYEPLETKGTNTFILPDENNLIYTTKEGRIRIENGSDGENHQPLAETKYKILLQKPGEVWSEETPDNIWREIREEGVYQVQVISTDQAGNSASITYTIYFDTVAPSVDLKYNTTQNEADINIVTIVDDISGIDEVKYKFTNGYNPPDGQYATLTEAEIASLSSNGEIKLNPNEGDKNARILWVKVKDKAGNETVKMFGMRGDPDETAPVAGILNGTYLQTSDDETIGITSKAIEFNTKKTQDTIEREDRDDYTHLEQEFTQKNGLPSKNTYAMEFEYVPGHDDESDLIQDLITVYKNRVKVFSVENNRNANGILEIQNANTVEGFDEEVSFDEENKKIKIECKKDEENIYKIEIVAKNGNNKTSKNTYFINVDKKAPTVTFTPNGSTNWVYGYKDDKDEEGHEIVYDVDAKYAAPIVVKIEDAMAGINKTKTKYYWTVGNNTYYSDSYYYAIGNVVTVPTTADKYSTPVEGETPEQAEKREHIEEFTVEIPNEVANILENEVAGYAKLHVYTEDKIENAVNLWLYEEDRIYDKWNMSDSYRIDNVLPTAPYAEATYEKIYTEEENAETFTHPYVWGTTASGKIAVYLSNSDAVSGIRKYQYQIYNNETKTWPETWNNATDIKNNNNTVVGGKFEVEAEGKTIFRTRAVNNVGRAGEISEPKLIVIDTKAPEVEFHNMNVNTNNKLGGTDGQWVANEQVKVVAQDDPSGVNYNNSKYAWVKENAAATTETEKYTLDGVVTQQLIVTDGETTIPMPDHALGKYKLWVYVEDNTNRGDNTGNGAEYWSEVYKFDSSKPVEPELTAILPEKVTVTNPTDGTTSEENVTIENGGKTNKTVTIFVDNTTEGGSVGSGIAAFQFSTDEMTTWNNIVAVQGIFKITIDTEGTHKIYFRAINGAGTASDPSIFEVTIDKTKPVITVTPDGLSNAARTVDVTINVSDALTGLNDANEYKYVLSKSATTIPSDATPVTFENGKTFTIGEGLTGKYYLHVLTSKKVEKENADPDAEPEYIDVPTIVDKVGNQADKVVTNPFYFNNEEKAPTVTFTNVTSSEENPHVKIADGTEENNYVRSIRVRISVVDEDETDAQGNVIKASGVKRVRYLWKKVGELFTLDEFTELTEGNINEITSDYPVVSPAGVSGQYILYVYAEDNFGNNTIIDLENGGKTVTHSAVYYIDDVVPTGELTVEAMTSEVVQTEHDGQTTDTVRTEEITSGTITNKMVTVCVNGASATSGIKYQYSIDNGATWKDTEVDDVIRTEGENQVNDKIYKVTFNEEGEYSVIFRGVGGTGLAGNTSEPFEFVIDRTAPVAKVTKSTEEPTNGKVTVLVQTNEEIQAVEGWTLSEDKKSISKEFEENVAGKVTVKDNAGNETEASYVINNIDKIAPEVTVTYSETAKTKEHVIVTITANEEIQPVEGWTLSDTRRSITKEYANNVEREVVEIKDLAGNTAVIKNGAGNTSEVVVSIKNIDKVNPVVTVSYDYQDNGVLVTLTSDKEMKPIDGWTLSRNKKSMTKLYTKTTEEILRPQDLAGNEGIVRVNVVMEKDYIRPSEFEFKTDIVEGQTANGITEKYIRVFDKKITVEKLLRNLNTTSTNYKVYELKEEKNAETNATTTVKTEITTDEVKASTIVKTGKIVIEYAGVRYIAVMMGDLNGDGDVTFKDLEIENKIRLHPEEAATTLDPLLKIASDINGDGKVTFMEDMVKINALRLK